MNEKDQTAQDQSSGQQITSPVAAENTATQQPATKTQLQEAEHKIDTRMSAFERSMIRLTWAAVIISILSGVIFAGQLYEMITGGTATDKLVGYSLVQANAASDQADAAQQFSDTAEDINSRMSETVNQVARLANATQQAAQTARDTVVRSQRPWLAVEGSAVSLQVPTIVASGIHSDTAVSVRNYGQSPALHVAVHIAVTVGSMERLREAADESCKEADMMAGFPKQDISGHYIFPGNAMPYEFKGTTGSPDIKLGIPLDVVGCISYGDQFKIRHHTRFCYYSQGSISSMVANERLVSCPINEEAD